MKIAINLIPFSSVQGTEIFTKNIIKNLIKIKKKDDEFFIFISENLPELLNFPQATTIKIKGLARKGSKAFYQQFNIYFLLKKYKIDLLFCPSPAAPFFYRNKVVTIYDCAYNRYPELFDNFLSKIYIQAMYCGAKYFSKKIITSSNFAKKELTQFYKINPEKIEVIYGGPPELPKINEEFTQKTIKKFEIDAHYFIYIGNSQTRKNIPGLLKAFKIFSEKYPVYKLVLAGKIDKRFLDINDDIKKVGLQDRVIQTDFVSEEEKVALYKKAIALTFPSYYEGFGLPVLESQSLGIPVLTSNTASLPEVGGNSVLYVNPYDIENIVQGMEKIVFNEELREDLIKKGFENIKRFSWEKSAEQLLNVFRYL